MPYDRDYNSESPSFIPDEMLADYEEGARRDVEFRLLTHDLRRSEQRAVQANRIRQILHPTSSEHRSAAALVAVCAPSLWLFASPTAAVWLLVAAVVCSIAVTDLLVGLLLVAIRNPEDKKASLTRLARRLFTDPPDDTAAP